MASHQLAIAKATFSASLLRPDPTAVSRDEVAKLHSFLTAVVLQCSPINVQNCKQWILINIFHSTNRFAALGKYLVALASSVADIKSLDTTREPSIRRKRLHILYLVNDILYHAKYRDNDASICGKIQPILMSLLGSSASFTKCPKHQRKILDLLALWQEKGYYSNDYMGKLRDAVKNASELGMHTENVDSSATSTDTLCAAKGLRSAPYIMPAMHGDLSTSWFDLPAANLMPHIEPNSTRPIKPEMIKPLQLVAGPADASLVVAVKTLLEDVQNMYGGGDQDNKAAWDIDQLGQPIILDEITGDVLEGEGYYGWRRRGLDQPVEGRSHQSRSRRRYSSSSTESRSPRRALRRDISSSQSRTPEQRPKFSRRRSSSPPRRSRTPSKPVENRTVEESSYAAPLSVTPQGHQQQFSQPAFTMPTPAPLSGHYTQHTPNPPHNENHHQMYGWNNAPPPPSLPPNYAQPPPNNYQGQWPPPLPPGPLPPFNYKQGYQQQQYSYQPNSNYQQQPNFQQQGGFPLPPPPTGPLGVWQNSSYPDGRGFNNGNNQNGWNNAPQGRGGRGNYGGRGG
ncbi:hypothetical protein BJ878DRAFT_534519 [Calycina marina]|uniref:CID domain-containing protein n=1 Tax=Calycina marina TaxID=1763456 RepID=A0A9P8CF71_9HELO|nr:hypothetical protein BJ878DRAFT_534519 [Calycina marina]